MDRRLAVALGVIGGAIVVFAAGIIPKAEDPETVIAHAYNE